MPKRELRLLLEDINLACTRIMQYTDGLDFNLFFNDIKTMDAVVRNIQIIGEAANQVPIKFQHQHSQIEWTKIIRSRHIIVHEYFELDYEIIWKVAKDYVKPLKDEINKILRNPV